MNDNETLMQAHNYMVKKVMPCLVRLVPMGECGDLDGK